MLAKVNSFAVVGLDAVPVEVEVDIASQGLPSFTIVGLSDKAVEEAKERARSAIKNSNADFPAKNPCPCGYLGDKSHNCSCTSSQIMRYQKRVSDPMIDRIDMHIEVLPVNIKKLQLSAESSRVIRKRVQKARDRQTRRFKKTKIFFNAEMSSRDIKNFCKLTYECINLLTQAAATMHLSTRSYHRTIKLAPTIADLEGSENIMQNHIAEALQYRPRYEN